MKCPMAPFTRRSFALALLVAPLACPGCGDSVTVETQGGDKKKKRVEDLEKKKELSRTRSAKTDVP
jgi:hypothetical protein